MGNPRIGKSVSVKLPDETVGEIERIAKKRKMKKADVYRMMLDVGIGCHRDLEKVGIISLMDFGHVVKLFISEKAKDCDLPGREKIV